MWWTDPLFAIVYFVVFSGEEWSINRLDQCRYSAFLSFWVSLVGYYHRLGVKSKPEPWYVTAWDDLWHGWMLFHFGILNFPSVVRHCRVSQSQLFFFPFTFHRFFLLSKNAKNIVEIILFPSSSPTYLFNRLPTLIFICNLLKNCLENECMQCKYSWLGEFWFDLGRR